MRKEIRYLLFMFCIILILLPQTAYAKEKDAEENDIYDSLQESIHKNWEDGFADLEATDEIEILFIFVFGMTKLISIFK